jgi:glycosyltransferase involved in cell wall biosynthesis
MKVSVIIGSRNRIETLLKFLPWTLAQDYPDFEVLILDDASDQPYTSQISPTLLNHPHIKWFRSETPLGVGGGRNYLMHQASGDLLMSVDDDGHFSDLCTLTRVVNHAAHYPQAGNLVGRVINHTSSGNYTASPFSKYALRLNPTLLDHEQPVSTYIGPCCAIRRTAFQATGGYTMKTLYGAEEVELSYRLI